MLQEIESLGTSSRFRPTRDEAEKSGKLKFILVSLECLLGLLRQGQDGKFVRLDGVPADAMIVGLSEHFKFAQNLVAIKLWSDSFPALPEAATMPELVVECSLYQEN